MNLCFYSSCQFMLFIEFYVLNIPKYIYSRLNHLLYTYFVLSYIIEPISK